MKHYTLLLLSIILFTQCGKDNDDTPSPTNTNYHTDISINYDSVNISGNTILPLGASRVQGDAPNYYSFRYPLWKKLIEGNKSFDFIGIEQDNYQYPDYLNTVFDNDHEGHAGWTSSQILSNLPSTLNTLTPDIVLFSSPGGNDLLSNQSYDGAISNINSIIDLLQADNPNVTILIEYLAPGDNETMTPEMTAQFTQMRSDITHVAINKTTNTSTIIPVDMSSGFSTSTYLADPVHYNETGAEFIASQYYGVLEQLLD